MPKANRTKNSKPSTKSRAQIISLLKSSGPLPSTDLAERLEITAMAIRQHLYELYEQKIVDFEEKRLTRGRPVKMWYLTSAGDKFFHDGHADLMIDMVGAIRQALGGEGLDRVITQRANQQLHRYRSCVPQSASIKDKLEALAKLRTEEGYMAEYEVEKDGTYLFLEHHCPICSAAKVCQGFCSSELDVFREFLGSDVCVTRNEHIVAGARKCSYVIKKQIVKDSSSKLSMLE